MQIDMTDPNGPMATIHIHTDAAIHIRHAHLGPLFLNNGRIRPLNEPARRALASTDTVDELCEVMHDAYEAAAVTAVADVPPANQETMRAAVTALLGHLGLVPNDVTGVDLIADERQRQITVEGYTETHDDGHVTGELAWAAQCYVLAAVGVLGVDAMADWPWEAASYHPSDDSIRDLVKAGALIVAEIDRRIRRGEQT